MVTQPDNQLKPVAAPLSQPATERTRAGLGAKFGAFLKNRLSKRTEPAADTNIKAKARSPFAEASAKLAFAPGSLNSGSLNSAVRDPLVANRSLDSQLVPNQKIIEARNLVMDIDKALKESKTDDWLAGSRSEKTEKLMSLKSNAEQNLERFLKTNIATHKAELNRTEIAEFEARDKKLNKESWKFDADKMEKLADAKQLLKDAMKSIDDLPADAIDEKLKILSLIDDTKTMIADFAFDALKSGATPPSAKR